MYPAHHAHVWGIGRYDLSREQAVNDAVQRTSCSVVNELDLRLVSVWAKRRGGRGGGNSTLRILQASSMHLLWPREGYVSSCLKAGRVA
jgi:hypothetical protein